MKTLYFLLLTILLLTACDKPVESDVQIVDMQISKTTTPATATADQNIVSAVELVAPNSCYGFAYFTVYRQNFLLDIHAKGTIPVRPTMCLDYIRGIDTTLSVPVSSTGTYVLRFYNGDQLFTSDTVEVN